MKRVLAVLTALAACAEAVLDTREGRLVALPASADDIETVRPATASCSDCESDWVRACRRHEHVPAFARFAMLYLGDDGSQVWTTAQRCASELVPRRAAAFTLAHARAWAAAGAVDRLADCLDGCALADATRAELERMEPGDG